MSNDRIKELIERLEKASGPERELFEAAFFVCFGKVSKSDNDAMARWIWYSRLLDAAAWTDAALTLVPDYINRRWYIADSDSNSAGQAVASVYHPADITKGLIPRSAGAIPAIALCIAALRAIASQPHKDAGR